MLKRCIPVVAIGVLSWPAMLAASGPTSGAIREAVRKAVPLLQSSPKIYLDERSCFGCHHQLHPALALTAARSRGLVIDEDGFRDQVERARERVAEREKQYRRGEGPGGQVGTAGSALWLLRLADHPPDSATEAVVEYLLRRDDERGYWRWTSNRPPSGSSSFATTQLALFALRHYATEGQRERADRRTAKALQWLLDTPAEDTEDRVFRLWALELAGADADMVTLAAEELLATQNADGGWAQSSDMDSDAYATGTALSALHEIGSLTTEDPRYRRGLNFLLDSQRDDGTWHVRTRARPIQTYFESGFPHGKDQFISISATAWATRALALALSKD